MGKKKRNTVCGPCARERGSDVSEAPCAVAALFVLDELGVLVRLSATEIPTRVETISVSRTFC